MGIPGLYDIQRLIDYCEWTTRSKLKRAILVDECVDGINNKYHQIICPWHHGVKLTHPKSDPWSWFPRAAWRTASCLPTARPRTRSESLPPSPLLRIGNSYSWGKNVEFGTRKSWACAYIPEVLISPLVDCWPMAGGTSENRWLVQRHVTPGAGHMYVILIAFNRKLNYNLYWALN